MILIPTCLIVLGAYHALADLNFIILHNNDIHGRFEETTDRATVCPDSIRNYSCLGGVARAAHVIREYRQLASEGKSPEVLYLNAGDVYSGTTWFVVHKWKITVEMMNLLEPDAMTLGNHEFDEGVSGLIPFVKNVNFDILLANADFRSVPELHKRIQKSTIRNIEGHKIGIIGCLIESTNNLASASPVIITSVLPAVRAESEKLHSQGVEIIILLSHTGFRPDKRFAYILPYVDIVVGAHSHTFLYTGFTPHIEKSKGDYPFLVTQRSTKKVPVVQAFAHNKYLGLLNVTFDDKGNLKGLKGYPILLENSIPQDDDVLEVLDKYRPTVSEINNHVVGRTTTLLDADNRKCFKGECNIGNLITDAFVSLTAYKCKSEYWTTHPIGLIDSASIRTSISPRYRDGNITHGDVIEVAPYSGHLVRCSIKGIHLRRFIEQISGRGTSGILQVSGLRIIYNVRKYVLKSIISIKARCGDCQLPTYEDLCNNKIYNITTTEWVLAQYHYLNANQFNLETDTMQVTEVLVWYLEGHNPVMPEINDRLLFVERAGQQSFVLETVSVLIFILPLLQFI